MAKTLISDVIVPEVLTATSSNELQNYLHISIRYCGGGSRIGRFGHSRREVNQYAIWHDLTGDDEVLSDSVPLETVIKSMLVKTWQHS